MSNTTQNQSPTPTGDFSSIFQSPGGPPLILVCIAAGLLLGAFIGVLLMRRMRPHVVVQRMPGAAFFGGLNPYLGEKPKLLDVHLVREDAVALGEAGKGRPGVELGAWGCVSPFAAVCLPSPAGSPTGSQSPSSLPSRSPSPSPNASRNRLPRFLARVRRANPPWRARAHEHPTPSSSHDQLSEPKLVQLAVTISLPSPERPTYLPPRPSSTRRNSLSDAGPPNDESPARNDHEKENAIPDCCIGTVVVSYRPASNNDAAAPPPSSSTGSATAAT